MSAEISSTLELTSLEKSMCTHGTWMTICYAAHLTGDESIIIQNIRFVIPHLLKRHSRMRSRIQINGYQHSLEIFDYDEEYFNPNLFYSIIDTTDQSWQEIADKECHRNPYSNDGKTIFPLFHFMLILNENSKSLDDNLFHLLLFSNHCASDGRSGFILMNDFLTLVTSSDLHDRIEPINTEVIPCLTQLTPRPYGILYPIMLRIARRIFKREIRKLNHPRIPVKTTLIDGELTPFRFQPVKAHFLFTSTSTTLYSRLHEKCHSQQVTLHGPLFACLLLAIHHCFPIGNKKDRYLIPFNVDLAFDMRSRLPNSPLKPTTVGFCVGLGSVKFKRRLPLVSTGFWMVAKKCVAKTNKCLTSGETFFIQHLYNDTIKNEQVFNDFASVFPEGRMSEIGLSNIGKYPYSCDYNQGQLRLRGLHIINNTGVYHISTGVLVTCVGDGQLDISLATEIEPEQKAQEFLDYYVHLIEKCADADIGVTLEQLLTSVEH